MSLDASTAPRRRGWIIALLWAALALINASQTIITMRAEGMKHSWGIVFVSMTMQWLVWAAATPVILELGRRYFPPRTPWPKVAAIHLASWFLLAVFHSGWVALLRVWLNPWGAQQSPRPWHMLVVSFFNNQILLSLILYFAVLTAGRSIESRERLAEQQTQAARLSAQLSRAQLDALRHQLEPHFLFNALNGIAGLVRENRNARAVEMIAGLSDLLRQLLDGASRQIITLEEEIDFIRRYLVIQHMRFENRLVATIEIPPALLSTPVPNLVLQPLVENAIRHGIARRTGGGQLRITAAANNGHLLLSVSNDGPLLKPDKQGVGLGSTGARLRAIYHDAARLELHDRADGLGVEALLTLPLKGPAA